MASKYDVLDLPAAEAESDVLALWKERGARAVSHEHTASLTTRPGAGEGEALFRWACLTNPKGASRVFVLRANGEAVGAVGVAPRVVSTSGRTLSAGLLGDFFVAKAHRTFFPALTLQRAVLRASRARFDLVYGFPNAAATPLIQKLGFRPLAQLRRYVLVLRSAPYLEKKLGRAAGPASWPADAALRFVHPRLDLGPPRGWAWHRMDVLGERVTEAFANRSFPDLTAGRRDPATLTWRFLDRPDQPASFHALVAPGGAIDAWVILRQTGEIAHVADAFGIDFRAITRALVLAGGEARRRGAVSLSFACSAPPALRERLAVAGFRVRDEPPRILYGHAGDGLKDPLVLSSLERWYATEADEDQ
jgi:hypothetical protein